MPNTSFAVMTKARAKFGKRLSAKDYQSLLACQSVTEVMSYLKSYTRYSKVLEDMNERDVHRGRLETVLRQNLFNEFDSLCRYDSNMSDSFSRFIIERIEVEQIMHFLMLLGSNSTEKFIYQFPSYIASHCAIDFSALANAKNYDEFLNALSSSQFYSIMQRFKPDEKGRLELAQIENKLYERVFENLYKIIKKNTKGTEQQELASLLTTINDYNIFSSILRLKKYYKLKPETIKNTISRTYSKISAKAIDQMCKAETSGEVFAIMQNTNNGRLINKIGYVYASDISPRVKYRLARKNMRFSNNPSVVLISYVFVTETELMNIICLIEGVRYKLDTKKIQSLLIY